MADSKDNYLRAGIHGHCACNRKHWRVHTLRGNYSAFNGYHFTPSDYSALHCKFCGHCWRTKARYVDTLPMEDLRQRYEQTTEERKETQI